MSDLDQGTWTASAESYSFTATVVFFAVLELVAIKAAVAVWGWMG